MNHITIKNTKTLMIGIGFIAAALIVLMIFSIERTAWLIAIFEGPESKGLALAYAIIVEVAAIAFITAEIMITKKSRLSYMVLTGLILILVLQSMANLIKGGINGWHAMLDLFGGDNRAAILIAAGTWAIVNGLIPLLIFILSKLLASFIQQLLAMLDTSKVKAKARNAAARNLAAYRRAKNALIVSLKAEVASLKAALAASARLVTRYKGGRKKTARRIVALRSHVAAYRSTATQTTQALEKAQADLKAATTYYKGQIESLEETRVRLISDYDRIVSQPQAQPISLSIIAAWVINNPQATIASIANEVYRQTGTYEAARLAFAVSPATLKGWLALPHPEIIQIDSQQKIEV